MRLMAIDPGNFTGFALLVDGELKHFGLETTPVCVANYAPDKVVIEKPQMYRSRLMKGDPNDLINLAVTVGRYAQLAEANGAVWFTVTPGEWKGQIPKKIHHARLLKSLTVEERKLLNMGLKSVRTDLQHNILDAIGLARWAHEYKGALP